MISIKEFIDAVLPDHSDKVMLYQEEIPLFNRYQIESQIELAFQREISLTSGGSSEVLPRPLVLTIALILSGIFRESNASLIWSLSSPLILLDIPPDLDEFGIKTIKRPASPIWVQFYTWWI